MSVFDSSTSTTTTMPSWFTDAQKNIATTAGNTFGAAMPIDQTVGQQFINQLGTDKNPFTANLGALNQIAQGNVNAFDASGNPNTSSPLGALFAAQNKQLDVMLPALMAKEGAAGLGGGNFGSLRGQTATETARAGALAGLQAAQTKAMMDAQNQAINAATAGGNIGQQEATAYQNLSNWQQLGNLPALAKYSDIINAMGPTTDKNVTAITKGSPYENLLKGINAVGAIGTGIDKIFSGGTGLSWLDNMFKSGPTDPMASIPNSGDTAPAPTPDEIAQNNADLSNMGDLP